ncbi:unnamed protein product [Mytilus coruscus]|uniref:Uncharacterized protein n=1 Tax=Mytilus coruscus TaxID=42192 RepID=A0A6J8DER0_MYTCO|nr:unnamed protein product [Mytilus coruscus]
MSKSNVRQPSFAVLKEEENSASPLGVRSRLPAMSVNLDSDMNRSLIDLTPSGEVQMRVNRENDDEFTTPRAQAGATKNSMQTSTESTYILKLRQELNELRERESMLMGLLESHSGDESRKLRESYGGGDCFCNQVFPGLLNDRRWQQADHRGLSDQCYGPSTTSLWQTPPNINDGCSTVRVERNGCVDTMTPPVRRTTSVVAGNGIYSENSHPTFNINDNSVSKCVPRVTGPSVHFKN